MKRLPLLLAALLACGLVAAGCGDDDGGDAPADDVSAASVEACTQSVGTIPQLSEEERSELEGRCREAGDHEDLSEANREICRRFVEEAVPDGSDREQALEACDNAATP